MIRESQQQATAPDPGPLEVLHNIKETRLTFKPRGLLLAEDGCQTSKFSTRGLRIPETKIKSQGMKTYHNKGHEK